MFGGDTEMLTIGTTALRINFCITPILGFVILATTFFQSLGKAMHSIVITLLRQIACLVPFIYILPRIIGVESIFFA
jgi:Na+-driven multidrug efflux pump